MAESAPGGGEHPAAVLAQQLRALPHPGDDADARDRSARTLPLPGQRDGIDGVVLVPLGSADDRGGTRRLADGGTVVHLGSIAADKGAGGYGAAKAGLASWNVELAVELGSRGVTASERRVPGLHRRHRVSSATSSPANVVRRSSRPPAPGGPGTPTTLPARCTSWPPRRRGRSPDRFSRSTAASAPPASLAGEARAGQRRTSARAATRLAGPRLINSTPRLSGAGQNNHQVLLITRSWATGAVGMG